MNIDIDSNVANLKVRRQRFGIGSLLLLLVFGVAFTGAGIFALKSNKIDPGWTRVSGEIVESSSHTSDGSTTYAAVVRYQVDGQSYKVARRMSSSSYPRIGEKKEVAYNPTHPDQSKVVETASSQWFLYIFPLAGIACLVIAPLAYIRSAKRSANINRLMHSGQKLQGIIVDIQSQGGNNNGGYKLVVSATDTSGTVQNYISDSLTGIGGLAMADFRNNPIPIDVYVDPANSQNYYVDVAGVPNLTPERIAELIRSVTRHEQSPTFADGEKPPTPPINPTPPSSNNLNN